MRVIGSSSGGIPLFANLDTPVGIDTVDNPWTILSESNPRKAILQCNFKNGKTATFQLDSIESIVKSGNKVDFNLTEEAQASWVLYKEHVKLLVTFTGSPSFSSLTTTFTLSNLNLVPNLNGGLDLIDTDSVKVGELPRPWIEYDANNERNREYLDWSVSNKSLSISLPQLTNSQWLTAVLDPTVITTSTIATSTGYSNQRKIDRTQNGVVWATYWIGASGSNQYFGTRYSTDDGVTWVDPGSSSYIDVGDDGNNEPHLSFFIDINDYAHVVYKDGYNGYTYYRRGTPNASRTAWTWSDRAPVSESFNSDFPDLIAHPEGTGWKAHVVLSSSDAAVFYCPVTITSAGTISVGVLQQLYTGNSGLHSLPSIDFHHIGDSKTVKNGEPHLYVAWSGGFGTGKGIRFKKATYSGGTWTWGVDREIDSTRYLSSTTSFWLNCLFDGERVVLGGALDDNNTGIDLIVYERDELDTTTTTRILQDNPSADQRIYLGSMTYDSQGNLYLFGLGSFATTPYEIVYGKWTRATNSWSGPITLETVSGISDRFTSTKRGYSGGRIEWLYVDGSASPYSIAYDSILTNQVPFAPTNLQVSPSELLEGDELVASWTHNDSDGDPQAKYKFRERVVNDPPLTTDLSYILLNGEEGGWYDPSDLSTLWQDSAGTIPVGNDGDPVALVQDKSGSALTDYVTNGSFDSDLSGWILTNTVTWDAGTAKLDYNGSNANAILKQKISVPGGTGKTLKVRWNQLIQGTDVVRTRVRIRTYADNADLNFNYYYSDGLQEVEITLTDEGTTFNIWVENAGCIANVDNIQVLEEARTPLNLTGSTTYRTDGNRHWLEGGSLSGGSVTLQPNWAFVIGARNAAYDGSMASITGSSTDYIRVNPYVSSNRVMVYTRLGAAGVGQTTHYDSSVPFGEDTVVTAKITPGNQSLEQNGNPPTQVSNSWLSETLAGATIDVTPTDMRWYGGLIVNRQLTSAEEKDVFDFLNSHVTLNEWAESAEVTSSVESGSFDTTSLIEGIHELQVATSDATGFGPWSDSALFTLLTTNVSVLLDSTWSSAVRLVYNGVSWIEHNPQSL